MRMLVTGCLFLCAASPAAAQCLGDFNRDGTVSISELVLAVGNALSDCQASQPRFVDQRDGTITDHNTELTWEKKTLLDNRANPVNLHDADNAYNWSGSCSVLTTKRCQPTAAAAAACAAQVDGDLTGCSECGGDEGTCTLVPPAITTIWDWLTQLNTAGFAGHSDWRIPTPDDLLSIVTSHTTSTPAAFEAFHGANCGGTCGNIEDPACSCTSFFYWSASAFGPFQGEAWEVDFNAGTIAVIEKSGSPQPMFARAVRRGS